MKCALFVLLALISFTARAQSRFAAPPALENLEKTLSGAPDQMNFYSAEAAYSLGKLKRAPAPRFDDSENPFSQAAEAFKKGTLPSGKDLYGKFRLAGIAPAPGTGRRATEIDQNGLKNKDGLFRLVISFGMLKGPYLSAQIQDSSLAPSLKNLLGATISQKVMIQQNQNENSVEWTELLPFSDGTFSQSGWHYFCKLTKHSNHQLICAVRAYLAPFEESYGYAPDQLVEYASFLRVP